MWSYQWKLLDGSLHVNKTVVMRLVGKARSTNIHKHTWFRETKHVVFGMRSNMSQCNEEALPTQGKIPH